MTIFDIISLFGGLAMFLYGMRMMGNGLQESSSGALKNIMKKVTDTPLRAFLLGLIMTAVIQSSKATIVITAGLVGAGIISLHQSLGIIIGANVGTTVTGQIIRLLDVDSSGASFLKFFTPSTLAPLALMAGIIMIMGVKFKGSDKVGQIVIGFGILFSGLIQMTDSVSVLTETVDIESLFSRFGENPLIGGAIGTAVAFVLQSASASIGIIQAFSTSGQLTFSGTYAVLVGIYFGDCLTTAIVCNIGTRPNAKRVGIVNILFNVCKVTLIMVSVNLAHQFGWLDTLWDSPLRSGGIANVNTIFNLACALLMLPVMNFYERLSFKIIKDNDDDTSDSKQADLLEALSPVFFKSPALAFNSCYEVLLEMFHLAKNNINTALDAAINYDDSATERIMADEDTIDLIADKVSNYLTEVSAHITGDNLVEILNHYYTVITEFERLGDHAVNIVETARSMNEQGVTFTPEAVYEINVLRGLIETILSYTEDTFKRCDATSAKHIEPLEEVVDDMVNALKQNHLERLREGRCSLIAGTEFLNMLSDIERISDLCSNVGTATIARVSPKMKHEIHDYVSRLHAGNDEAFNAEYHAAHDRYFRMLQTVDAQVEALEYTVVE